jgi:hypothetical protein
MGSAGQSSLCRSTKLMPPEVPAFLHGGGFPVRRTTSTCSTVGQPWARAWSTAGLRATGLVLAEAPVGGDHGLGLAIVEAIPQGLGGKAPNTTEWGAPMRAQASMAMAASGTIGM